MPMRSVRFCAGRLVVARWGYKVGEVIAATPAVEAWAQGVAINTVPWMWGLDFQ